MVFLLVCDMQEYILLFFHFLSLLFYINVTDLNYFSYFNDELLMF